MIKRVPLKKDPSGQCSRWRVIVYNIETKKYDWHTVRGTRADAKALERKFEDAKRKGEYVGPLERKTFAEMANLFMDDRRANNRRLSTLEEYQTELRIRLLPPPNDRLPPLGPRDIRNIKRADMKAHFNALRNSGCTVSQVNKSIKTARAIFTYSFDLEAFNVSRVIGHARSTIVDTIYAHTVDSALADVSERVTERVGLTPPTLPPAPGPPTAPRQPPKLRVLEGGRRVEGSDQRDIRRTIDDVPARSPRKRTSD